MRRRFGGFGIRRGSRPAVKSGGGGAAASELLDLFPGAAQAYSFRRRLRAAYAGAAYRVERASDAAQQDIGFDGTGAVDTAALASFCGASVGTLVTLYDQSTNGEDLGTTTTDCVVYDGSAVVVDGNGDASCRFDVSGIQGTVSDIPDALSVFEVGELEGNSGNYTWAYTNSSLGLNTGVSRLHLSGGNGFVRVLDPSAVQNSSSYSFSTGTTIQQTIIYDPTNTNAVEVWVNGVSASTGTAGTLRNVIAKLALGANNGAGQFGANPHLITEWVSYYSDQTADRASIEAEL